ncbi:enoyl-acyl carrier reductase, putative [Eimeria brunetti]|uniref:Enoyl-acyl carrier reductase, putative n=1 Tax=Eimeria brunetti TaxID=51314 RepID=U6LKT2_9EIME|nr:enoyl-acyl carrier reductase, putative [Eimeria brunetti]
MLRHLCNISVALLLLLQHQQQQQQVAAFRVVPGADSRGAAEFPRLLQPTAAVPSASLQQQQQAAVVPAAATSSSSNSVSSSTAAAAAAASEAPLSGPLPVDLRGKTAFVAAGARVLVGTWPPVYGIFRRGLEGGKFKEDEMYTPDPAAAAAAAAAADPADPADPAAAAATQQQQQQQQVDMAFYKVYPLDAAFDYPGDVPPEVASNKRYAGIEGYTISEVAAAVKKDVGNIDILVHSLANGPEVTKPLLQTSRAGYLSALSSSSYSFVSLLQHFLPLMNRGGAALALSYIASQRAIPGYGGGMSSAKAALESDCRTLAFEAGRQQQVRVNCISAGPLRSRAAAAIGSKANHSFIDLAIQYSKANAPLQQDLESDDVGRAALFLLSPLARAISGETLYVDNGLHAMGQAVDSQALAPNPKP